MSLLAETLQAAATGTVIAAVLFVVGAMLFWAFDMIVNAFAKLLPKIENDAAIRESLKDIGGNNANR